MKYKAIVEQFCTESPSYIRTVTMDAQDLDELNKLLDLYANEGEGPGIEVDDSKMPESFGYGGGFCSKLLSFTDENGVDYRYLDCGTF
jgi:hypothetical protein